MLETDVMAALTETLPSEKDQELLKSRASGADITLADLDMTSLHVVEICMHLEDNLGIEIDLDEFDDIKTLSALVQHCEKLLAEKQA